MENENLSTDQLIELALNEKDEDLSWDNIRVLHKRATKFLKPLKIYARAKILRKCP